MNATATVTLLGGLGLFLLGIHHLTEGLKGLAGDSLRRAMQRLVSSRFSAVVSGAIFTAVKMAPETTALKRLDTSRCIARRSESPASPFRPSVRWWIPSRNRPSPPRSVTVAVAFIDCV